MMLCGNTTALDSKAAAIREADLEEQVSHLPVCSFMRSVAGGSGNGAKLLTESKVIMSNLDPSMNEAEIRVCSRFCAFLMLLAGHVECSSPCCAFKRYHQL